jgi:hypothetical protein
VHRGILASERAVFREKLAADARSFGRGLAWTFPGAGLSSGRMLGRRQEFGAVATAVVLHAAALWLLASTHGARARTPETPRALAPSGELSFDVELGDGRHATEPTSSTAGAVPRASGPRAPRPTARPGALESSDDAPDPEATVAAESTQELRPTLVEEQPQRPIDLGLGPDGWQRWVSAPNDGVRPKAAERPQRGNRYQVFRASPASTTGGILEGLEARDRELGLDPSGRVVSALHLAARTQVAPELGTARFAVTVRRTGEVEVTLAAASGDVARWQVVAARVADDLRSRPPKIAPPRTGMRLAVELVAEQTLPNGTATRSLKEAHVDVPPLKFRSTEEAKKQLQADNPTTENPDADTLPATNLEQPGLYVAQRAKVCSYRAGLGVLAPGAQSYGEGATPLGLAAQGACDPSHIGAKSQRRISTRVVELTMF